MQKQKIIVTGGAGYIGSHAVKLLLDKNYEVVVIDNLYRGYKQVIEILQKIYGNKKLKFYQLDLKDYSKVENIFLIEKPDLIMHFAALCLVDESMKKPEEYFENNIVGSLNVLKAMVKANVKKIVFSSTCAVYGESQYLPIDEDHPTIPLNPYGESKLVAEKMLKWFGKIYNINYAIFRYFNVGGSENDGSIGDSKKPSQLLMQNVVRGALNIEPFKLTCPEVNTPDKTPIRDYIDVVDLVTAHLMVIDHLGKDIINEVFNLGVGRGSSVLEIVNQVKKLTKTDFLINKGKPREGEYAEIYADSSKAKKIIGWTPKKGIKESVDSLIKWYKRHPNGWEY